MQLSNWDKLRELNRTSPMGQYQQMFPEHRVSNGMLKMAVDSGNFKKMEADLVDAMKRGTPITDWSPYMPASAETSVA